MSIKPILFNTEMVRAILDGRKTATRRVCNITINGGKKVTGDFCTSVEFPAKNSHGPCANFFDNNGFFHGAAQQKYFKGDVLYVRETWAYGRVRGGTYQYFYKADYDGKYPIVWHPSIHMPREAARIFLRVTDVRVERLQDIDDDGVVAEGLNIGAPFDECWNRTIKPEDRNQYGWDANPWVWVISFEKISSDEYEAYIGGGNKEAK